MGCAVAVSTKVKRGQAVPWKALAHCSKKPRKSTQAQLTRCTCTAPLNSHQAVPWKALAHCAEQPWKGQQPYSRVARVQLRGLLLVDGRVPRLLQLRRQEILHKHVNSGSFERPVVQSERATMQPRLLQLRRQKKSCSKTDRPADSAATRRTVQMRLCCPLQLPRHKS